ncbi:hypothetical protein HaLaN_00489, partial [Haematococcus lacustris]
MVRLTSSAIKCAADPCGGAERKVLYALPFCYASSWTSAGRYRNQGSLLESSCTPPNTWCYSGTGQLLAKCCTGTGTCQSSSCSSNL